MQADKERISGLLKTARGQIDGIMRMVEEDRYCIDIANQLMATQAIRRRTNQEILRAHLEHCVKTAVESGDADEKIDEIVKLIDKMNK